MPMAPLVCNDNVLVPVSEVAGPANTPLPVIAPPKFWIVKLTAVKLTEESTIPLVFTFAVFRANAVELLLERFKLPIPAGSMAATSVNSKLPFLAVRSTVGPVEKELLLPILIFLQSTAVILAPFVTVTEPPVVELPTLEALIETMPIPEPIVRALAPVRSRSTVPPVPLVALMALASSARLPVLSVRVGAVMVIFPPLTPSFELRVIAEVAISPLPDVIE